MVISLGILILFCLLFILRQVLFNLIPFNSGFYSSILDFVIDVEFCLFRVPVYIVLVKPEYSTCSTSFTCSKYSATFLSSILIRMSSIFIMNRFFKDSTVEAVDNLYKPKFTV